MKKMKVRMNLVRGRRERELKKMLRRLERELPDLPEEFQAVNEEPSDEDTPDLWGDYSSEMNEVNDFAEAIAAFAAERAVGNFLAAVYGVQNELVAEMIRMISRGSANSGLHMLKGMFYARGMKRAAEDLDIIVICEDYCEDIYEMFIDDFMQAEEIDWLLMEDTLREVS